MLRRLGLACERAGAVAALVHGALERRDLSGETPLLPAGAGASRPRAAAASRESCPSAARPQRRDAAAPSRSGGVPPPSSSGKPRKLPPSGETSAARRRCSQPERGRPAPEQQRQAAKAAPQRRDLSGETPLLPAGAGASRPRAAAASRESCPPAARPQRRDAAAPSRSGGVPPPSSSGKPRKLPPSGETSAARRRCSQPERGRPAPEQQRQAAKAAP